MSSVFDPSVYLETALTEPSLRRPPLPVENPDSEDKLYTAVIESVKARSWTSKADPLKSGVVFDVTLAVEVPASVQTALGLTTSAVKLSDGIMLNLTPTGAIDNAPGANGRLRQYREATDLNKAGESFKATDMIGRVIKVKVGHEMYNGEVQERVATVARS